MGVASGWRRRWADWAVADGDVTRRRGRHARGAARHRGRRRRRRPGDQVVGARQPRRRSRRPVLVAPAEPHVQHRHRLQPWARAGRSSRCSRLVRRGFLLSAALASDRTVRRGGAAASCSAARRQPRRPGRSAAATASWAAAWSTSSTRSGGRCSTWPTPRVVSAASCLWCRLRQPGDARPVGTRSGSSGEEVPAALAGQRLDRVVAMVGRQPAEAAALVAGGGVRVDGTRRPAVGPGWPAGRGARSSCGSRRGRGPPPRAVVDVPVVHVDDDVVVVDKPAGLVVHPGAGKSTGTLCQGPARPLPGVAAVGEPDRPGIVHRLDNGTSGLMLVARTPGPTTAWSPRSPPGRSIGATGPWRGALRRPRGRGRRPHRALGREPTGWPSRARQGGPHPLRGPATSSSRWW